MTTLLSVNAQVRARHIPLSLALLLVFQGVGRAQAPDLTVVSVTGPAGARVGGSFSVSSTLRNAGTTAITTSFTTQYLLSTDNSIGTGDVLVGSFPLSSLAAGASSTDTSRTVTVPSGTAPGTYFLGLLADSGDDVIESSETNNTGVAAGTFLVSAVQAEVGSTLQFTDSAGTVKASYLVGTDRIFVRLTDADEDTDGVPGTDEVAINFIRAPRTGGDLEASVSLPESATQAGVFLGPAGGLPTAFASPTSSNDGVLQGNGADVLEAQYIDGDTATDISIANARLAKANTDAVLTLRDPAGSAVASYLLGAERIRVRVVDEDRNLDAGVADTLSIVLTGSGGDRETLTLTESGASTGTFEGDMPTASGAATPENGTFQASGGDTLTATYTDTVNNSETRTAQATLLLLTSSTVAITDSGGGALTQVSLGIDSVFLTVTDGNQDKDSSTQQTLVATVTSSQTGDTETVQLRETGNATGTFRNLVGVPVVPGSRNDDDGTLQSAAGAQLTASYTDPDDAADAVQSTAAVRLEPTSATVFFTDANGNRQFNFTITTDRVFVTVTDADRNVSSSVADTVAVTVTDGRTGDRESLTLLETGANTGVFRNGGGLSSTRGASAVAGNGNLETADGATLTASYTDPVNGDTASDTAAMRFLAASTTRFTNQAGGNAPTFTLGLDPVFVTVTDADENGNTGAADTVNVQVSVDSTMDQETVLLTETGGNTGAFRNTSGLTTELGAAILGDGRLQVTAGTTIRVTYTDPTDAADVSTATATVPNVQAASTTRFTDTTGAARTQYRIGGELVFVTVTDGDQNTDATSVQQLVINLLDGTTGDLEEITLVETGVNTGVFRNTAGVATVLGARNDGNGLIETANLSNITANYRDPSDSSDTSFDFATMQLAPTNSVTRITDGSGNAKITFTIGSEDVFVTVEDSNRNDNISTIQQVSVLVRDQATGDQETITLVETAVDSGVFRNAQGLVSASAAITAVSTGDGLLESLDASTIVARYIDATDPSDSSFAIAQMVFKTGSTTRLTDQDGNEVGAFIAGQDGVFVTVKDLDKMSLTTGTLLPDVVNFDPQVQTVLNKNCWKCHSPSGRTDGALPPGGSPSPNQGGLDATGFRDTAAGGNNPPVLIPGQGSDSLIIRKLDGRLAHNTGSAPLPIITTSDLIVIRNWIDQGAVAPTPPTSLDYTRDLEAALFQGRCDTSGCHNNSDRAGGLSLIAPSESEFRANNRITPGNGPGSRVVRLLKGELTHTGTNGGLSAEQIRTISIFISQQVATPNLRLEFTGDVLPLLDRSCSRNVACHDAVNPAGNLDVTRFDTLDRGGTSGRPYLPGDGPESLLIKAIDGSIVHTGGFGDPPMAASETQLLIDWINQGATAPPAPPPSVTPVTTNSLFVTITDSVTGDIEDVTIRELASFLGTFRNQVGVPLSISDAQFRNGTINSAGAATLTAQYRDPRDPGDTSQDTATVQVANTGSITSFTDSAGGVKTQFSIAPSSVNDRIFVTVDDPNRNNNPQVEETVEVALLDGSTGDSEVIQLRETGPATGRFRNPIGIDSEVGLAIADNKVQSSDGANLTANYQDPQDASDFSFALASMLLGPSATQPVILFTDAAGAERTTLGINKDPIFVTVTAFEENTNASVRETITLTLTSRDPLAVTTVRDTVRLSIEETAFNTSTFRNGLGLTLTLGNGNPNNNSLEAIDGDELIATFFSRRRNLLLRSQPNRFFARITPGDSTARFTRVDGTPVTTYTIGDEVFLTVTEVNQNKDPNVAESLAGAAVVTSTLSNDREVVTITETGPNTSVFRSPRLTSTLQAVQANNGFLEVGDGAILRGVYTDPEDNLDVSDSAASIFTPQVDASVAFIDRAGGAAVTSYFVGDAVTGQRVFVRLGDTDENRNPTTTQTVNVTVRNEDTGDVEALTLSEVGVASRFFENQVGLPMRVATASPNDGTIGVKDASRIIVTYRDSDDPLDIATAAATVAVTQTAATTFFFSDRGGTAVAAPYQINLDGIFLTLRDADENRDPSVAETVQATLTASASIGGTVQVLDTEVLTLVETAGDSATFRNQVPGVASTVDVGRTGDGILQTASGATLSGLYIDAQDPSDRISAVPAATTTQAPRGARVRFVDAAGNPVSFIQAGFGGVFIQVTDLDENVTALTREQVQVSLSSSLTNDSLSVLLTETTSGSGVFRNTTGVPSRVAVANTADATLQTAVGASVTARYQDSNDAADTSTDTVRVDALRTASRPSFIDAAGGNPVSSYRIGLDPIFIRVVDEDQDVSPLTTETVQVTLTSANPIGDEERVELFEVGTNSGTFENRVGLASVVDRAVSGDGRLQSGNGVELRVFYRDVVDFSDTSEVSVRTFNAPSTAAVSFSDAAGTGVGTFRIGQDLIFVTLVDPDQNTDPSSPQSVAVTLTDSVSGDRVVVTLPETGFNAGVFRNRATTVPANPFSGGVPSEVALPASPGADNVLQTGDQSTVRVSYVDTRLGGGAGSSTLTVTVSATAVMDLAPSTSTILFTDQAGTGVGFYTLDVQGSFVTVTDIDENRDPRVAESVSVTLVATPSGDQESLTLLETTSSSASFRNTTPLPVVLGLAVPNDGTLQGSDQGTLTATYQDAGTPADRTTTDAFLTRDQRNSRLFFTRSAVGSIVTTYQVTPDRALSDRVFLELRDGDENVDASTRQSAVVTLTVTLPGGGQGDREVVSVQETSTNTEVFRTPGTGIPTQIGASTPNNGVVETQDGATLTATYADKDNPRGFAVDVSSVAVRTGVRQSAAIVRFTDSAGVTRAEAIVGTQPLFITVEDSDENTDPTTRETVSVTVVSGALDQESLTLVETSLDTGTFRNTSGLPTRASTSVSNQNGFLEVQDGGGGFDSIRADYVDDDDGTDARSATGSVAFRTRSTLLFTSAAGLPVSTYIRGRDGIVLSLADLDQNQSAVVQETVTATVRDPSAADEETVELVETAANTGIFRNSGRPLTAVFVFPPIATRGDGVIQGVAATHLIEGSYRDPNDAGDAAAVSATVAAPDANDVDGDGITDTFELANGLDSNNPGDAALDNDQDGRTNLEEFREGTDPNDPTDNRPVARPGVSRNVQPGLVTLDGRASSSPSGLALTYRWTQVSGGTVPIVTLLDSNTAMPRAVLTQAGAYQFELIVNNGRVDSFPGRVTLTVANLAPTAFAGPVQTINAGETVSLQGLGSADPNGDALTYTWIAAFGGLPPIASEAVPSFTPLQAGVYPIDLRVADTQGASSARASRTFLVVNGLSDRLPAAEAGPNRTAQEGEVVTLDGSVSADSDGGGSPKSGPIFAAGSALTYRWTFVSGPEPVTLVGAGPVVTFTPRTVGVYTFELVVNDSTTGDPLRGSVPDRIQVTVNGSNSVPTADAGEDRTVNTLNLVALDGSGSTDADGDPLTYEWTQTLGPSVALSSATSSAPSFTPYISGLYEFALTVRDGRVNSASDTVRFFVNAPGDTVPVANAGEDVTGQINTAVVLDGSGSFDADGSALTYIWSQVGGPPVTLGGRGGARPSLVAARPGLYAFDLTVSDGRRLSGPDRVLASVASPDNRLPLADAGPNRTVFLLSTPVTVALDGSGSTDLDGNLPLTYTWTQTSGNRISLLPSPETVTPTFTPPVTGNYRFDLTVRDSTGLLSVPDEVVITVVDGTNAPPVARVTDDRGQPSETAVVRTSLDKAVTLDGSASQSLDGSALTFAWEQTGGPAVALQGANTATPTFVPRVVGTYSFKMTVTDEQGRQSASTVTVFAGPAAGGATPPGGVNLGSLAVEGGGGGGCTALPAGAAPPPPAGLLLWLLPLLGLLLRRSSKEPRATMHKRQWRPSPSPASSLLKTKDAH